MSWRALLAGVLACLAIGGCVTENSRGGTREPVPALWPEAGAPDALLSLADDLAACQAATGRLPDSLDRLDHAGLASGGPYAGRAYAYHPTSIGVLREGWHVLVADDRVREADKVWCVVRPPIRLSGTPALRVVLVPVIELREAAASAGGGR